ncbi:MAG: ABC transporter permease [Acidobacteriota bacterium]
MHSLSLLRVGAWMLAAFAVTALAGPGLVAADPDAQLDPAVARWQPPGSSFFVIQLTDGSTLLADHVQRAGDQLIVDRLGSQQTIEASRVTNLTASGVSGRARFPLGSDRLGRDVLARLLQGARVSLAVGLSAVLLGLILGLAVGAVAGGFGGWADGILMRSVDALLCFPQLVLVLAIAALIGPSLALVVLVLGGTAWMPIARLVRAEIVALKERDFVAAARAVGETRLRILLRHLLPNALTPALIAAALLVSDLILGEATLSFLGLGVQAPTPSWGAMIAEARDSLPVAWWGAVFPGTALALTVMACNLVADGLRDRLDPRQRRSTSTVVASPVSPP